MFLLMKIPTRRSFFAAIAALVVVPKVVKPEDPYAVKIREMTLSINRQIQRYDAASRETGLRGIVEDSPPGTYIWGASRTTYPDLTKR